MADKALPIIFLNLSGEMIYVIQQRLEAQNITEDKSHKVIQDIVSTMLNDQFIEELFKPQNMYSRSAMQSVFEKLVHSSIMRLNANSMGKLYDLMLMVFKYQVMNCSAPEDIMLVTLNHLDAIKKCAKPYPELKSKIENIYALLLINYKNMSHESYECLYNCVVAFLQDLNIRVSVLMKLGLQSSTGEIIKVKSESLNEDNLTRTTTQDDSMCNFEKAHQHICFDIDSERGINLGTNIYAKTLLDMAKTSVPIIKKTEENREENINVQAVEEITLLGRLIGKCNQSDYVPEILLSSNDDAMEEIYDGTCIKDDCSVVKIDASQVCQTELGKISNEFFVKESAKKNDILELLDIADDGV